MKIFLIVGLGLLSLAASAQKIKPKQILADIETLSSDKFEGRKTGTKGSELAQEYIIGRFKKIGIAPLKDDFKQTFTFKSRQGQEQTGTNLVGVIPGKNKEVVVISAHYDHLGIRNEQIFNGADDNASGVGGLLAIAGYFKKHKPNYTLVIATFDAEESGLQGAKAFVAAADLSEIRLNLNMDMISHSDKAELYACGTLPYPTLKKYVATDVKGVKLIAGHDDPKTGHDDWTNQSDQGAFNAKKIPFLYFGVEDHQDYHKASDEFSTITKEFYTAAVKAILQVAISYDKDYGQNHSAAG